MAPNRARHHIFNISVRYSRQITVVDVPVLLFQPQKIDFSICLSVFDHIVWLALKRLNITWSFLVDFSFSLVYNTINRSSWLILWMTWKFVTLSFFQRGGGFIGESIGLEKMVLFFAKLISSSTWTGAY